jgi:poly-gamma-glutamate synthesis protein (capsule biosynthesis protein)
VPTATPIPVKTIAVSAKIPSHVREGLIQQLQVLAASSPLPAVQLQVQVMDSAAGDVIIGMTNEASELPLITRTYAVVAPFPTAIDSITSTQLIDFWNGDGEALSDFVVDTIAPTLFINEPVHEAMSAMFGAIGDTPLVQIITPTDLISLTWAARPTAFAIVPFDELDARWKVLHVNGINLMDKDADMAAYPFNLRIGATGNPQILDAIAAAIPPSTNRDLSKMSVVAMTGVTALVRGTAVLMEQKGITYPGQLIQGWLATADIAHISNEVSFWDKCPPPTFYDGVSMCSNPKYIELLQYVGADVIELTGNHLWDKGVWFLSDTIKMYDDLGWGYFGGGMNLEDAMQPLTLTVNGNRIAFVGCNWFGANWATDEVPGSAPCSANNARDLTDISNTIRNLRAEGYLVIATLQYAEFYDYTATYQQALDFAALRDAGAVVVNGSQGHHAQGFDVNEQGFIHYGTGNLFFGDQAGDGTHQTFVDRHVFYDGKYLGVDLRTAFIVDWSQPKPMEPNARAALLKILFRASGY